VRLADFLAEAAGTPFRWGASDCCLWLADWLVTQGRPDPAADLRGRYSTPLGCARLLNKRGGVLGVVASCAAKAGLTPADAPRAGDVGVVEVITPQGRAPAGAICTGPRWAVRGVAGLIVAEMTPLAAWRV
jgi:hypothetical protein